MQQAAVISAPVLHSVRDGKENTDERRNRTHDKENPGDASKPRRDSAEGEDRGYERNHREYDGMMKHPISSSSEMLPRARAAERNTCCAPSQFTAVGRVRGRV
jgi:hypothetical protein